MDINKATFMFQRQWNREYSLKKHLRLCAQNGDCYKCEMDNVCDPNKLLTSAADLIESLQAQLAKSQRRERAAVDDMKVMALVMRESEEISEGCCFACKYDAQNLPGDVILAYGECPGYECSNCFEWRGDAEEE